MTRVHHKQSLMRLDSFTADETVKLVTLVIKQPALYDVMHPSYRDNFFRDSLWTCIAQHIGKPNVLCRKLWYKLKDRYCRNQSRQVKPKKFSVEVYELMKCIDGALKRRTCSNRYNSGPKNTQSDPHIPAPPVTIGMEMVFNRPQTSQRSLLKNAGPKNMYRSSSKTVGVYVRSQCPIRNINVVKVDEEEAFDSLQRGKKVDKKVAKGNKTYGTKRSVTDNNTVPVKFKPIEILNMVNKPIEVNKALNSGVTKSEPIDSVVEPVETEVNKNVIPLNSFAEHVEKQLSLLPLSLEIQARKHILSVLNEYQEKAAIEKNVSVQIVENFNKNLEHPEIGSEGDKADEINIKKEINESNIKEEFIM